MAKYDPFFEKKVGMHKTAESQPVKEAFKVLELLKTLDFNTTFLHSQINVLNKLSSLNKQELSMLKAAFSENKHPRFIRGFSFHDPYGKSEFFKRALKRADLLKVAKLVGIRRDCDVPEIVFDKPRPGASTLG